MHKWFLTTLLLLLAAPAAANEYSSARKLGAPETKVMGCPDGAFWDPRNGGECWSCGSGKRAVEAVTSERACLVAPRTRYAAATRLEANKTTCSDGSFLDIGKGTCWRCPEDTNRSVFPVDGDKACSRRVSKQRRKATFVYKTGSLLKACRGGTFANVGSQSCYTCPEDWKHDPTKKVKSNGVCFKPAKTHFYTATETTDFSLRCASGFYDPIDRGSCWSCPSGFERHVTSVKSAKACIAVSAPKATSATFVKRLQPTVVDVARGISSVGCGGYGKKAFFDLKDGGSCWSCPGSHPRRTLYPVHESKACATTACGSEDGRPCFVWERIPSCDSGLVEDPINNRCVRPKNLACTAYVKTLAGFRSTIDQANRLGNELQDEAFERVPGGEALLNFAVNQYAQARKALDRLAPEVDTAAIEDRFQVLLTQDPEFFRNLLRTVRIVAEQRESFLDFMTDPDQICSGNLDKLVNNLKGRGLYDAFRPTGRKPKGPIRINMGQLGGSMFPVGLAGTATSGLQLAAADTSESLVGRGSRNRLIIDFTLDFPVKKVPGGVFSPGLQVAIPLGDQAEPGLYFQLGGYGGMDKTPDGIDDFTKGGFGTVNLGVGFQWGGLARHKDNACMQSKGLSLGAAVKVGGIMGFGVNPYCTVNGALANSFGGFGFSIGGLNVGALEPLLTQVEMMIGPEGFPVAKHKTQKRFQFVQGSRQLKVGPEASIQLLPVPNPKEVFRVGAAL